MTLNRACKISAETLIIGFSGSYWGTTTGGIGIGIGGSGGAGWGSSPLDDSDSSGSYGD